MRTLVKVGAVVAVGLLLVVGAVAYTFFKPAPEASAPIQAAPLDVNQRAAESLRRYEIQPGESEARFVIDEILRGEPKTVVGTTNQVAGQLAVNPNDLDTAQVGTITINARTFATDSSNRDRMTQNRILETANHEYITFQPKSLVGLPASARVGQVMSVQVVGDLSIRGVTREVTFDATVTPESADRIEGDASTTIRYADWGIAIPQVPSVTGVSDQVQLQISFVATSGEEATGENRASQRSDG